MFHAVSEKTVFYVCTPPSDQPSADLRGRIIILAYTVYRKTYPALVNWDRIQLRIQIHQLLLCDGNAHHTSTDIDPNRHRLRQMTALNALSDHLISACIRAEEVGCIPWFCLRRKIHPYYLS